MLWTLAFWRGTAERAIKTGAQTIVAQIAVATTIGTIPWVIVGSTTALAMVLSVVTSIGNANFTAGVDTGSDSDTTHMNNTVSTTATTVTYRPRRAL